MMARWSIDLIRKKMQPLGTVDAPTQKDAFEAAIKRFEIAPALQAKITVTKIGARTERDFRAAGLHFAAQGPILVPAVAFAHPETTPR